MNSKPTLVVLAAGMGSRFGGLKQIAPVGPCGETLLDYAVYDASRAGFGKVVVVIHSSFEQAFREQLLPRLSSRMDIHYTLQDKFPVGADTSFAGSAPWGTGYAVLTASEKVDEPFAVVNADDYYGRCAFTAARQALEERWQSRGGSYFLVSYELGRTLSPNGPVSRGICKLNGSRLTSVIEHLRIEQVDQHAESDSGSEQPARLDLATPVSMNFWGFTPDLFPQLHTLLASFASERTHRPGREFHLPEAIHRLVDAERAEVEVIPAGSEWFGITYQADHNRVCQRIRMLIDAGTYPERLWTD